MNWSLEKLYERKIAGAGNVPLERLLVREYKSAKQVGDAIADANPIFRNAGLKKGAVRIMPTQKIEDKDKLTADFKQALNDINFTIVQEIDPGPGSFSSKFKSYKIEADSGEEYVVTLAGGSFSNKGMQFERQLLADTKKYFDNPNDNEKPRLIERLEDALNVKFVNVDPELGFSRLVKRPLSPVGPSKMGEEISDLTLVDENGKKYYISLKDVGGVTVANNGAAGMFSQREGEVEFTNKEKNNIGGSLMEAAGVDINRVVSGLEDYIKDKESPPGAGERVNTTEKADLDKLKNFIKSGFDYGYVYVKLKNTKGDAEIENLMDEEMLDDFIGNINKVSVLYPYNNGGRKKRKHVSIEITTDKNKYSFDIRNASGGIIPNQINLVKGSSSQKEETATKSISKIETNGDNISSLLSKI